MELLVRGMSCQHCVDAITAAVKQVPGVTGVEVDVDGGSGTVDGTPERRAVAAAIEDTGYSVAGSR